MNVCILILVFLYWIQTIETLRIYMLRNIVLSKCCHKLNKFVFFYYKRFSASEIEIKLAYTVDRRWKVFTFDRLSYCKIYVSKPRKHSYKACPELVRCPVWPGCMSIVHRFMSVNYFQNPSLKCHVFGSNLQTVLVFLDCIVLMY